MADENQNTGTEQQQQTQGTADDAVKALRYEADSAKAQAAKLAKQLEEIKRQLPSEEQQARYRELEEQAAKAEEDRQKKAGEWDALKRQLTEQFERERSAKARDIAERDEKLAEADRRFRTLIVRNQFNEATDWFGGDKAKTILPASIAYESFKKYVVVEDVPDEDGQMGHRVVVKNARGETILDRNGNPAPFAVAIGELIDSLPEKNDLLRGSGKTGSNSSGGLPIGQNGQIDLSRMKPEMFRDPKIREEVKRLTATAGGLQIGPAWDRAPGR